jgi:hypothetical protein
MPKYILANTIHSDGTGDFNHFEDVINHLKNSAVFKHVDFIPMVHFERGDQVVASGSKENESRIKSRMTTLMNKLGISNYWYGNTAELKSFILRQERNNQPYGSDREKFFQTNFKNIMTQAEQIIVISIDSASKKYLSYCKADIPKKIILEHENTTNQSTLKTYPMGLGDSCYGIKINNIPHVPRDKAWDIIEKNNPDFIKHLLTHTNSNNINVFDKNHVLVPSYFNNTDDFIALLDLFVINKSYAEDKNIVIYLSGLKNNDLILEKIEALQDTYSSNIPFNVEFIHHEYVEIDYEEDADYYHITSNPFKNSHPENTPKILILSGLYLENKAFDAIYQLSKFAGVSGDNSFERCVSMDILPFYWSTNAIEKIDSLKALKKITQLSSLAISDEARASFKVYFDPEAYKNHAHIYYMIGNRVSEKMAERKPSAYATINIKAMIDAWPQITAYLRKNKNLYNNLTNIVIEGTSFEDRKKIQRQAMMAMTNAHGMGHFVAKKDRPIITLPPCPEPNDSPLRCDTI